MVPVCSGVMRGTGCSLEGQGASIIHAGAVVLTLFRQIQQLHEEELAILREEW